MKAFQFVLWAIVLSTGMVLGMTIGSFGVAGITSAALSACEQTILTCLALLLVTQRLHFYPRSLHSDVKGFPGPCVPVWLQRNRVIVRTEGSGSGFFQRVLRLPHLPFAVAIGPEFHGYIRRGRVLTTEGIYGALPN